MLIKSKCFRCIFNFFYCNKYQFLFIFIFIFVILCCSHFGEVLNNFYKTDNNKKYCGEPIDIVYTWVNGTDPLFKDNLKKYLNNYNHQITDYAEERFDDKYELKFSLRSLEKYAPWVNHVYIVTNGQIPYWLNLDYEKVTVISHNQIFENLDNLPTFSSPAIESNIHRIPGLSKKFIYFNDDIFIGAPIYPEDFISSNRGFLIYLAWPLPSCMPNCPWIYVGDGQCDSSCYYEQCQFDGGDCTPDINNPKKKHHFGSHHDDDETNDDEIKNMIDYEYFEEDKKIDDMPNFDNKPLNITKRFINNTTTNNKISTLLGSVTITINDTKNTYSASKLMVDLLKKKQQLNSFKTALKTKEKILTNPVSYLVDEHNKKIILNDKLQRKKRLFSTIHRRKKYYNKVFNNTANNNTSLYKIDNSKLKQKNLDTYALSLQHSHRIFNIAYGFKARKVPAHAPILIDQDIVKDLQRKFKKEFEKTQKNKVRSANDMQYSFSYYYFLMNEKMRNNISDIFDFFDTDQSGTWSDREIRTILTRINELPLNYAMVESFDIAIINCSKHIKTPSNIEIPAFERYLDSKLPLVTKQLILNCPTIINMLNNHFGTYQKYNYEIIKNAQSQYVMFKMLTSNVSDVVGHLDEIRKDPRKFICLNDNMSSKKPEENDLVKAILLDFYLSLFPKASQFELPAEYRNRFSYLQDLDDWKLYYINIRLFFITCVFILCVILFYNVCKRKITRQIKRIIYFYTFF